jgi:hypothetical protein
MHQATPPLLHTSSRLNASVNAWTTLFYYWKMFIHISQTKTSTENTHIQFEKKFIVMVTISYITEISENLEEI